MNSSHHSVNLPNHKTKIICTIGPSTRQQQQLEQLILAGMNIARLNFSHGTLSEHQETIQHIKAAAKKLGTIIPILADLPGVKMRIGKLREEQVNLKTGDRVTLTTDEVLGSSKLLPISYKKLPQLVAKGQPIFLSDGFIELKVIEKTSTSIDCEVIVGGVLLSHKGVNVPGNAIDIDPITSNDLSIVEFCIQQGIESYCISFIQSPDDILKLRTHAKQLGKDINIIAKIERARALQNYSAILESADGIMIARGDLGVETPIEHVPLVQKQLIKEANLLGKPIIVATQMLKSMTERRRPTRAEVTDVANAILDGTDAVMLSEETAIGAYPIDTVHMMVKIASTTENKNTNDSLKSMLQNQLQHYLKSQHLSIADVISLNALKAQQILQPRYILTPTDSGNTPRRISRFKPTSWILSFSKSQSTTFFLQFSYGVYPIYMPIEEQSWHPTILPYLKENNLVEEGDIVLLTQGRFSSTEGGTDSLGIIKIGLEPVQ